MNVLKVATALIVSVAFTGTLAAAPQATKSAPPAKSTPSAPTQSKAAPAKPATMKPEMVKKEDLPKAVTDAVMKDHPKGTITSATKKMTGMDTTYSVKVKDGTKTVTMNLMADGSKVMPKGKGK